MIDTSPKSKGMATLFAEPSFIIYDGEDELRYAGALRLVVLGGKVQAVNIIGLEDYIAGVLSASGTSVDRLQKKAVEVRRWALGIMEARKAAPEHAAASVEGISDTPSLVTWLDLHGATVKKACDDAHTAFDVCSGKHCQPYKGILGIDAHEVRQAVDETWGRV